MLEVKCTVIVPSFLIPFFYRKCFAEYDFLKLIKHKELCPSAYIFPRNIRKTGNERVLIILSLIYMNAGSVVRILGDV